VAYSLVPLTVQCCIQTVCCSIQFDSAEIPCCIQTVCCGIQFGSADSTVLYTDYVLWHTLWFS